MTWPAIASGDVWTNARESFQLAAAAVVGVFLPAGKAWHIALAGRDACTLAPQAFAAGLPFSRSADTVGFLQGAAHQPNAAFPASASMR